MRTRTMKPLFLIFCLCLSPLLMGQNQNKIQEAMANYDYETAVELINKEPPTIPLLMQKAKALKGIGSNAGSSTFHPPSDSGRLHQPTGTHRSSGML